MKRGHRNNGLIEIEEEPSEDESEIEKEMSGVVYKVPEHGIKLDFIDRIKRYVLRNLDIMFVLTSLQFPSRSTGVEQPECTKFKRSTQASAHPNRKV